MKRPSKAPKAPKTPHFGVVFPKVARGNSRGIHTLAWLSRNQAMIISNHVYFQNTMYKMKFFKKIKSSKYVQCKGGENL